MGLKFLDLFAGIGGFRLGMESNGHECVGYVEIDKFARKSYEAIHNTEGEWTAHDITTVADDDIRHFRETVDVICGGFPCQAFSVAGKREGFEDTRGTLFFEIARFANVIRPRYLFLENVKGLLSHDGGNTFRTILRTLDELGYDVEWQLLNSKDFGVPQNRERVFIIGHLRGSGGRKIFPLGESDGISDSERMESATCISALTATDYKGPSKQRPNLVVPTLQCVGRIDLNGPDKCKRVYDPTGLAPTLTANSGGYHEPKIIQKPRGNNPGGEHDIAPTVTSRSYECNNHLVNGWSVRKLTPRECWRLQSYPDWAFDKAAEVNSNNQLYKQAGNSVTVNVIKEVAKRL